MMIEFDNQKLRFSGRIDTSNPKKPQLIYPSSFLQFRFYGKSAEITVTNHRICWNNYMGAIIDGEQRTWQLNDEGKTTILLVDEEIPREHEVLFFKRQDCCHVVVLEELNLSEESRLLDLPPLPARRIEVYGDSVSAGEVSEAVEYTGKSDPEHYGQYSNSYYSYAWIAARKLNARIHNIAQGGIPLVTGTGWVAPPIYPGMDFMWDKLHYHPQLGKVTNWDFSLYRPHVVIIAVGQNDSNPEDYMKENPTGEKAQIWKQKYKELILNLREKYPKTLILLTTTILEHDVSWDAAIEEVCQGLSDERVRHFLYRENGRGTPGHIRISEAERMADELVDYLNRLDIPVWEDEELG